MHISKIYKDKDACLKYIQSKKVGIIGFGNQGKAQALNLRDSGVTVHIGGRRKGDSLNKAQALGFEVGAISDTVQSSDFIVLLIPDQIMSKVFESDILPYLRQGQSLCFSHGYNIHYKLISPPDDVNVIMAAPSGAGIELRRNYEKKSGIPGLFAIHQDFSKDSKETSQLASYRHRLENSLLRILDCDQKVLYDQKLLSEHLVAVSKLPEEERNWFFNERLRALFSSDYRTYLTLKNRYFQLRLQNAEQESTIRTWLEERLNRMLRDASGEEPLEKRLERLDFRAMEQLMKDLLNQFGKTFPLVLSEKPEMKSRELFDSPEWSSGFGSSSTSGLKNSDIPDLDRAYRKLCLRYQKLLLPLSKSLKRSKDECTSPFFMTRCEEYTSDQTVFFEQFFSDQKNPYVGFRRFVLDLLNQRGEEFHARERWDPDPRLEQKKNLPKEAFFYREASIMVGGMERKTEWSLFLSGAFPAQTLFPMPKGEKMQIKKNTPFVIQLGTAFFDQDQLHQSERKDDPASMTHPDGFFRLMLRGQVFSRKSSVVYFGKAPYFTATRDQALQSRGWVLLMLIAVSLRFAIDFSQPLKKYLVENLPENLEPGGKILEPAPETDEEPA